MISLVLFSNFVLAAQPIFTIRTDGTEEVSYTIELLNVERDSVLLSVTNSSGYSWSRVIDEQPSAPYTVYNFPNTDLKIIVTNAKVQNLDFNATILAGFEMNFSVPSGVGEINMSIDELKNKIEFVSADDNSATIKITNSSGYSNSKEIGFNNPDYPQSKKINDFLVILKYSSEQNLELSASVLVFYEKNFFVGGCENECNINDKVCDGNGYKLCGDYDEDVCWEWGEVANCNSDETCENGVCIEADTPVTCSDRCSLDDKKCFNDTNYQSCGNYDSDSCLEWGESILCPMGPIGRICDEGECITGFPDPTPEPTRECEPIGLRENTKYCNNKYK